MKFVHALFFIILNTPFIAIAQLENNECLGAIDISSLFGQGENLPQTSNIFDNTMATSEASDPSVGFECFIEPIYDQSIPVLENTTWYSFVGDGNIYYLTSTLCQSTNYIENGNTQMALFSGNCDNLFPLLCNEDGPDSTEETFPFGITFKAYAGVNYYLMVDGFNDEGNPSTGEFCLEVTKLALIECDDASAGIISGDEYVCHNKLTTFKIKENLVPTDTQYGFCWIISSEDISGSQNPFNEPSFIDFYSISNTVYFPIILNDGSEFDFGTYYFTAMSFGSAFIDMSGNYIFNPACIFTSNSTPLTFLEELQQLEVNQSIIGDSGFEDGSIHIEVIGGSGNYTYEWSSGEMTSSINGLSFGEYNVTISDASSCVAEIERSIMVPLILDSKDVEKLFSISIYPNPASTTLIFSCSFDQYSEIEIEILDRLGKVVKTAILNNQNDNIGELDISCLFKGVYFIKLRIAGQVETRKLFVN